MATFQVEYSQEFSENQKHCRFFTESKTISRIYVLSRNWGLEGKIGDVILELDEKKYRIKEVDAPKAMGAMITKEADSMSAKRISDDESCKGLWDGP